MMNIQLGKYSLVTLLICLLALSAFQRTEAQAVPAQPPEHAANDKKDEEKDKEKEKEKEKNNNKKNDNSKQPPPPPKEQLTPQQQQQKQQERQRDIEQQKQQERALAQKRAEEQRRLQQKRVTQQEMQARIQKQEQQLAVYRKNIALREELAERDAQILRQQKRIQHLRFQEQYEERLRAQRAQLNQARYDYQNDPYYYTAPNYRYQRNGQYYQTNQYGMKKLEQALQAGYNEGYRAGRADREDRWRYDYRSAFAYKDANYGYDGRYIPQDEYNHYFREGFQRGYDDGYYDRQKYGRKKDDGNVIEGVNDEWLIAGGVIAAIIGYQLLTD
jgi:outer membrane biosynthesis protein TonB